MPQDTRDRISRFTTSSSLGTGDSAGMQPSAARTVQGQQHPHQVNATRVSEVHLYETTNDTYTSISATSENTVSLFDELGGVLNEDDVYDLVVEEVQQDLSDHVNMHLAQPVDNVLQVQWSPADTYEDLDIGANVPAELNSNSVPSSPLRYTDDTVISLDRDNLMTLMSNIATQDATWWYVPWEATGLDQYQRSRLRNAIHTHYPDSIISRIAVVVETELEDDGSSWLRASIADDYADTNANVLDGTSSSWSLRVDDAYISMWQAVINL